jgi:hypothetical protein
MAHRYGVASFSSIGRETWEDQLAHVAFTTMQRPPHQTQPLPTGQPKTLATDNAIGRRPMAAGPNYKDQMREAVVARVARAEEPPGIPPVANDAFAVTDARTSDEALGQLARLNVQPNMALPANGAEGAEGAEVERQQIEWAGRPQKAATAAEQQTRNGGLS